MPADIAVLVENGFATIDFMTREARQSGLASLVAHTPPDLIEKLTRSGPRAQYRVPLGNAQDAGLVDDVSLVDSLPDRDDLGFADALVAAHPNDNPGDWHQENPNVAVEAFVADRDHQDATISGPLRPNKPVAETVPGPPAGADISTADLQKLVKANTPQPADYASAKPDKDDRVPNAHATIASVVSTDTKPANPFQRKDVPAASAPPVAPAAEPGEPSEKWTVPKLRQFATDHGIDLGEATLKADIVAVIKVARSMGK